MGKVYGRTATDFAAEALALALDDAGLEKADVDGLLINANHSRGDGADAADVARSRGPDARQRDERLRLDRRDDAPVRVVRDRDRAGERRRLPVRRRAAVAGRLDHAVAYSGRGIGADTGFAGLRFAYGDYGPANTSYALACRRHMHLYGTTHDQLGTIAVGQRAWAQLNPRRADARQADDARRLPRVALDRRAAAPLRLLPGLQRRGRGDRHVGRAGARPAPAARATCSASARRRPATTSAPAASRPCTPAPGARASWRCGMAGVALEDIDVLELYDCYTYTVLVTLEDYGFCAKGEGGAFVADGKLGPGGSLPTQHRRRPALRRSTCGASRRSSEGVIQARGHGGERQVPQHDLVLVSGNGGTLNWHSTTILAACMTGLAEHAVQAGARSRTRRAGRSSTARGGASCCCGAAAAAARSCRRPAGSARRCGPAA